MAHTRCILNPKPITLHQIGVLEVRPHETVNIYHGQVHSPFSPGLFCLTQCIYQLVLESQLPHMVF